MVECQTIGCKLAVGKNGRKGFCQKCYRKTLANSANESLNSNVDTRNDSVAYLFSTPPASLNQSVLVPEIELENASFKTQDGDYVTVPETPPQSVDELFAMIVQMKEEYNLQLKKRDEAIASLSLCVTELQEEVKKQEAAQKQKMSEGERVNSGTGPSSQQPIEKLKETVELQNKTMTTMKETVAAQQKTLENLQQDKRAKNLIITGIPEPEGSGKEARTSDESAVDNLLAAVECVGISPSRVTRLGRKLEERVEGENQRPPPRPLLVSLNTVMDVRSVLRKTNMLKNNPTLSNVYVKRDEHPLVRQEWKRLRIVARKEKDAPINAGCLIKVDYQKKAVTRDGEIIQEFVSPFRLQGPNTSE